MPFDARAFVVDEANLSQLRALKPNLAVLPWGATEAHNFHLPHGTDVTEAVEIGAASVERANSAGARCILLPCVPFGNDNTQLVGQVATITMRTRTQAMVLFDVADSLVRQGIDRLVILNMHGGNEFKPLIRDVMLDLPIFIAQINGYAVAPKARELLTVKSGDHADEFETCLMMHLAGNHVAPLETAGDGSTTASRIPALSTTPGVWSPRDWAALTQSTGVGDPRAATSAKGKQIFEHLVEAIVPVLVQLSAAKRGDFPFVIRE